MDVTECSTATALLAAYRDRKVSPLEITKAAFARIALTNPTLNALYAVDEEGALQVARESEARWFAGRPVGLVDGIPTTAKDALLTRGFPIYRGAAVHNAAGELCETDAPSIARLKEHGAVILGKTTMPDFGLLASGYSSKHGITRNPWNQDFNCGGSSSGGSVTVAAGISPFAVGTDIVGSIRLPASFCGLVGFRPSRGRVPYYFPNSPFLVAGPIARTVADAALLLNVITRPDARDFTALPGPSVDYANALEVAQTGARLGLLTAIGFGPEPDPEVIEAVTEAAERLARQGHKLSTVGGRFGATSDRAAEDFYRVRVLTEMLKIPEPQRPASAIMDDWTRPALRFDAARLYRCEEAMLLLAEKASALLNEVDYLLLPTYPAKPFRADLPGSDPARFFADWCNTFLFNLADLPALSINCGFSVEGLPIGIQIVGRRHDDVGVLRLACSYEGIRAAPTWPFSSPPIGGSPAN